MTKIAILDDYQNVALQLADWSALPASAEITVFDDPLADREALVERLTDFDVICIMRERTPFPRQLLERLPKLKLLVTSGSRNAAIDVAAAGELGITVCGTGSPGHATAEHTWGLILALHRNIPEEDRATREGGWQVGLGHDLRGRTLGVIGLGRLGSQVAAVGNAFGMRLIAWSQNLTAERAAECGATLVTKQELLSQADTITLHLRLSERTRGLLGHAEFRLMKPTAYLVNTSRGPIVDEAALIETLQNNRIAGAGLDVFDVEPLPADHPLRNLKNTVITPHTGYVTEETYRVFYGEMVEDIAAYLNSKPVRVMDYD